MPRIFDNIDQRLLATFRARLAHSHHADFCVGYFNLRGRQAIDNTVSTRVPQQDQVCWGLVGRQRPPREDLINHDIKYRMGQEIEVDD